MPTVAAAARQLAAIDVYDDDALRRSGLQQHVQLLEWQSYLKEDTEGGGGGGGGCL